MKLGMKTLVTAALGASLLTGTVAMANPHDQRSDGQHSYHERERSNDRRDDHGRYGHNDRRDDRGRYEQRNDRRFDSHERFRVGAYHRPHGYQYRAWRQGDRLPSAYRKRVYVVNDYHSYRLHQPPRGYHWVRVDNNVVLAAVATGVVLEVVSNLFY